MIAVPNTTFAKMVDLLETNFTHKQIRPLMDEIQSGIRQFNGADENPQKDNGTDTPEVKKNKNGKKEKET